MKELILQLSLCRRGILARWLLLLSLALVTVLITPIPISHSANLVTQKMARPSNSEVPSAIAALSLSVNTLGDTADINVGDGQCDTDANSGNGSQCTLRAAIQETN